MGSGWDVTGFHLDSSQSGVDRSWDEADRFLAGSGLDHDQPDLVHSKSLAGPSRGPIKYRRFLTSLTMDRIGTEPGSR